MTAIRLHRPSKPALAARTACGVGTIVVAVLSLASAITPDVPWRRELLLGVEPGPAMALGHVLTAVGGLAVAYLGWGILRGRRRAANLAIGALVVLALLHVAKGLDYEEAGVTLALAALIWANRRACHRGGAGGPVLLAATVAAGALAAAYTLVVAVMLFSDNGLGTALRGALGVLGDGAWWLRSGEPSAIALDVLVIVALGASIAVLHALLRPARPADGHTPAEHARAAAIVDRHARDSLDPFALREEKAFFFARGGLLAYRTLRETAVVAGDPVGPPGSAGSIVAEFLVFAAQRGWDVVMTAVSEDVAADCRALGFRTLCIGQEAVVNPRRFSLEGRAIRKVRQSVARAERRGWSIELVEGVRPDGPLGAELAGVEERWRRGRKRNHGFAMSLGRLWGAPEDRGAVYALGRAPGGELRAFVRFARAGRLLSLDVMRRSGDEPNGLNEALIVRTLEWARERGIAEVSLNFAGFAHVMASRASLTQRQRLLRWALGRVHRRFQLERLLVFNEKFRPAWRPRYLVYGARTHLPLAALRVLQAEAYVRPPRTRPDPSRWTPRAELAGADVRLPQPGASR
jgi:lysyl-tRNA synthetase class 2